MGVLDSARMYLRFSKIQTRLPRRLKPQLPKQVKDPKITKKCRRYDGMTVRLLNQVLSVSWHTFYKGQYLMEWYKTPLVVKAVSNSRESGGHHHFRSSYASLYAESTMRLTRRAPSHTARFS